MTGGSLELSRQGEALQYYAIDDVPEWFLNHEEMATDARAAWRD
ncbi:MAG: hypothetical protein ACI9YT_001058 [Halobacteriales archaeon]